MRRARWMLYLWPGLPQAWVHGAWSALGVALCFAVALDAALAARWLWGELIDVRLRPVVWPGLTIAWCLGICVNVWRGTAAPKEPAADVDLFPEAQGQYLQGNWIQTEQLCRQIVDVNGRDLPALLLLAATLRHAGRLDEAQETLDRIGRLDAASGWEWELDDERQRLEEKRQRANEAPANKPEDWQEREKPSTGELLVGERHEEDNRDEETAATPDSAANERTDDPPRLLDAA